jgi:formate hydrogenlyase subunit 3/multisubunit Na+/H+ antiporter MnhD subunit
MLAPAVALACGTVAFGLFPAYFFSFAERAGEQLMDPSIYIEAVLGPQTGPEGAP